jgi:P27 family predicted phage terminase small subunit
MEPTVITMKKGNPGHRKINKNEALPERGMPDMPNIVARNDIAKKEWERISPLLFNAGLLTVVDGTALAAYCMAFARWDSAEESLIGEPYSRHGIANANIKVANDAASQMLRYITEFGMTPSSRTKIRVDASGVIQPDSERVKYFNVVRK